MTSIPSKKGRSATKANHTPGLNNRNKPTTATHREVTPSQGAGAGKKPAPRGKVPQFVTTSPIPRKKSHPTTTETPEDFNPDTSPRSNTSVNLLEEESSGEESPPLCSQPSLNESIYAKPKRASLLELFEKEATPPPIRAGGKATKKKDTAPATVTAKAHAKAQTKPIAVDESDDEAEAAAAEAAAEANITPQADAISAKQMAEDEITSSQEAALLAGAEEYEKTEMEKQATTLASLSTTTKGTQSKDRTVKGKKTPLASPFKSAAEAQAEATAKAHAAVEALNAQAESAILTDSINAEAATTDAKAAKPDTHETMVKAHERKLKQHTKVWAKADAAVDTDKFIQATTEAFGAHTTSKLITNAIADLTRKLHKLTLVIFDYQAKASKFKDLPTWIPRSCKSGFTLSAPKDIPDDDPGLVTLRENVAAIQHTYESALRQCVRQKELLLLKRALHRRRELFVTDSLDIATNWLCLWLPKNQKLLRRDPLTIKEDQVVGIIFERLLTLGCFELRSDLDLFFNEDLNFHFMLAAKLRSQPRFKSIESPEKRIFRNRKEAEANGMYPFTKVTWDHDEYDKLEAAIRIIDKPLTAFLTLLCQETTFKFHQEYEDELNYKLAELQVEARLKKAAALSAAAATATALEHAKKAIPESVHKKIVKIETKMTQLQRTQQRQHDKTKTTPAEPQLQKNMPGGRDKRPSAAPKGIIKDKRGGRGNDNRRPPTPRPRPNNKRKQPEPRSQEKAALPNNPPPKRQRQPRRRPKPRQPPTQAASADDPPAASNSANRGTANRER
jgi:hypothetical protein